MSTARASERLASPSADANAPPDPGHAESTTEAEAIAEAEATTNGMAAAIEAEEEETPQDARTTSSGSAESVGLLPPAHWTQLAQDLDGDADSAIGDGDSSTETLSASILEYRIIHGRTYHSDAVDGNAQYWGSNDAQQLEAMDINHHFLNLCTEDRLHFAPIDENVQKVLDIGTGTGIWAIDFADEYPQAEVTGTDISPSQPQWLPPNVRFEIEDCTSPWTFTASTFDYVHMRYLVGSVLDWTALYKEAYKALKPGGWLESFEGSPHMVSDDGTIPVKSAIAQWGRFFEEGGRKTGRSFLVVDEDIQYRAMQEAGFVDIQEWEFKAPVGGWPQDRRLKEVGIWALHTLLADTEGLVLFMAHVIAGWTREETLVYMAHLRREISSAKYHAYFKIKIVWGRKPVDA